GSRRGAGQAARDQPLADAAGARAQRHRGQAPARTRRRRCGAGRTRAGLFAGRDGDVHPAVSGIARAGVV
ncbi:hypothetical protein XPR_4486, partial [Xanthomonas arboricola pv. pruni MAFF 301420]